MDRKMMKMWDFGSYEAENTYLSDYTKISRISDGLVTLVKNELTNRYPTDDNLYVRTATKTVPKLKSWDILQVDNNTPKSTYGAQNTTVKGRLYHNSAAYYWNGAAWVITTTQWNTLEVIHNNLASWSNNAIAFEINLKTTDGKVAPSVTGIRLSYTVELASQQVDWVYDTMIAEIQDNYRPMSNMVIPAEGDGTLLLSEYDLGSDFDITDVVAVYNDVTDPNHFVNLCSSYNASSKLLTLSAPQTVGQQLYIEYRFKPQVSYNASQDFSEVASLPSVVFDDITFVDKEETSNYDHIMNIYVDPPVALLYPAMKRFDIVFTVDILATLTTDLFQMQEEMVRFIEQRPTIDSAASGDTATLSLTSQFAPSTSQPIQDIYRSRATFTLHNLYLQTQDAISAGGGKGKYGVKTVNLTTNFNNNTKNNQIT